MRQISFLNFPDVKSGQTLQNLLTFAQSKNLKQV